MIEKRHEKIIFRAQILSLFILDQKIIETLIRKYELIIINRKSELIIIIETLIRFVLTENQKANYN